MLVLSKNVLGRLLNSCQVLSENTCLNIPSLKLLETVQHFGEIPQNIWVFFYNHQNLHPSETLYISLGMLWISIPLELDCKDFKSLASAASVVTQFSVVLEAVCFPSHTIFNSLSDISSPQFCITSVPDNAAIEGEGPFLNLFALALQRPHFCSCICHPFAVFNRIILESERIVETSILTLGKQVHTLILHWDDKFRHFT